MIFVLPEKYDKIETEINFCKPVGGKGFRKEQTHEISNFHWKSGFWFYQRKRIFPHGQWRSRMALRLLFRLIRKTLINIKHKYVLSESLECV